MPFFINNHCNTTVSFTVLLMFHFGKTGDTKSLQYTYGSAAFPSAPSAHPPACAEHLHDLSGWPRPRGSPGARPAAAGTRRRRAGQGAASLAAPERGRQQFQRGRPGEEDSWSSCSGRVGFAGSTRGQGWSPRAGQHAALRPPQAAPGATELPPSRGQRQQHGAGLGFPKTNPAPCTCSA